MNVLLIGSGGREHALAWKLAQSPRLDRLFCAPGNPGIAGHATIADIAVTNHAAVADFCRRQSVGLVVVGPEAPLVAGLADDLTARGIAVFGCTRAAAALEGSKGFTKDLCAEHDIPTAAYGRFHDRAAARAYLAGQPVPIVIKADGLAAGKGVTVAMTRAEAEIAVEDIFAGRFGDASCVIEEFLAGEEVSYFVVSDGTAILPLGSAQDHKRVGDGDTGPNTGGMGAYAPAPVLTPDIERQVLDRIIAPTIAAMRARGTPFRGVLFAGLMITAEGPKLIEYNVRFGDPECQVLMPRLESDLLEIMLAAAGGDLGPGQVRWRDVAALTVVMASRGYPGPATTGGAITLPPPRDDVIVFHSGTALRDGALIANGGRVLSVTAHDATIAGARAKAYDTVHAIQWMDGFCRSDIGWRALNRP